MNNKFNIGQKIYHVTPDSPEGVVIDIRYQFSTNSYEYLVAWAYNDSTYSWEEELSNTKRF